MMACEESPQGIALPELLDDLAGRGLSTVLVEGGAQTARSFLKAELVDRIGLFEAPTEIGRQGVDAPVNPQKLPMGFKLVSSHVFGADTYREYERSC